MQSSRKLPVKFRLLLGVGFFCFLAITVSYMSKKNSKFIMFPLQTTYAYLEIQLIECRQSSDTKYMDLTGVKIRKVNKTRKLFGQISYNQMFDDSVTLKFLLYKKQGGEYRLMPYKLAPQPYCEFMASSMNKQFYEEMAEYSTYPVPARCPFGNVSILL